MGEQFSFVYDIIVAAVLLGAVFAGSKKGFASAVVTLAAVAVSFICAMALSGPISTWLYTDYIEQPLEEAIDDTLDQAMANFSLEGLTVLDYSKVLVDGVPADDIEPNYAGTGKALFDLSKMDLSGTGIAKINLTVFGIPANTNFSQVSGKTAEFSRVDIEKYGIAKLCVAQYLAVNAADSEFFEQVSEYTRVIEEAVPLVLSGVVHEMNVGSISAFRTVLLTMAETSLTVKEAVLNEIIEPTFLLIAKTVAFIVIFAVVSIVLGIVASVLKIINKIPVLGKMNSVLGAAMGLIEGLLSVFIICIAVRLIVSFGSGSMIFFNETTIGQTLVFRHFYNFEFLNFLNT